MIYNWYKKLKKPSFAPPAKLFSPVWTILYIIIFFSFGHVFIRWINGALPFWLIVPFVINLITNLAFVPIQFKLKNNEAALVDILLVDTSLIWAMIAIFPFYPIITYTQIPYLLWTLFATVLQASVTYLNRKKK